MAGEQPVDKRYKWLSAALGAVILLYLAFQVFGLRISSGDGGGAIKPNFPPGGPAEFLYMDPERVDSYLAQVNGGSFNAETVTQKLSDSLDAKATIPGAGEAGASRATETSFQREMKPTDASRFFALRNGLVEQGELHGIGLRYFDRDVRPLEQGRFVTFETTSLLPPAYLNAFLAVREDRTVSAMFPNSRKRQMAAKRFSRLVGPNPRVVFALAPEGDAGSEAGAKPFVYLLPLDAARLTTERSLLKFGGGRFTVVGKLVRTFPEPGKENRPAYVDSATRETWEQPLRQAPGELLCRSDFRCVQWIRNKKLTLTAAERKAVVEGSLRRALAALESQTQINWEGAVILPVAIYK